MLLGLSHDWVITTMFHVCIQAVHAYQHTEQGTYLCPCHVMASLHVALQVSTLLLLTMVAASIHGCSAVVTASLFCNLRYYLKLQHVEVQAGSCYWQQGLATDPNALAGHVCTGNQINSCATGTILGFFCFLGGLAANRPSPQYRPFTPSLE